jgi:hypothetical protein
LSIEPIFCLPFTVELAYNANSFSIEFINLSSGIAKMDRINRIYKIKNK